MDSLRAIQTTNLTKSFGDTVAVNKLSLDIRKGELYGLVGPDGAGKTTTMRLLTAIMDPTSGDARVAGHSVLTEGERVREKIGYMSQRFGLYDDLTAMENILFLRRPLRGPGARASARGSSACSGSATSHHSRAGWRETSPAA